MSIKDIKDGSHRSVDIINSFGYPGRPLATKRMFNISIYKSNTPKIEPYLKGIDEVLDKTKLYEKSKTFPVFPGRRQININAHTTDPDIPRLYVSSPSPENAHNVFVEYVFHPKVIEQVDNPYKLGLLHGHKLLAASTLAHNYDTLLGSSLKLGPYEKSNRHDIENEYWPRLTDDLSKNDNILPYILADKYEEDNLLPETYNKNKSELDFPPLRTPPNHLEKLIDLYSDIYGNLASGAHNLPNLDRKSFINYMTNNIRRNINTDHTTKQVLMGILRGIHSGHV